MSCHSILHVKKNTYSQLHIRNARSLIYNTLSFSRIVFSLKNDLVNWRTFLEQGVYKEKKRRIIIINKLTEIILAK